MKPVKVMVIVPALNEEGAIGDVVRSVKQVMPNTPVLVVDDHSSDTTALMAKAAGAEVLRSAVHIGVGGCVRVAYAMALEQGYDYVIRVDGDGQHDAGYIPEILATLVSTGDDAVIGSRFIKAGVWKSSVIRLIGITFFRALLRPVLGRTIQDPTSGFIGINRRALEIFARALPAAYPEIGALILLRQNGLRFREIPCRMHPRRTGRSSFTAFRSLHYTWSVLRGILAHTIRPELPVERTCQRGLENE